MGRILLATSNSTDEEYGGTTATQASEVAYDNTTSGLTADDVQGAIDEVNGKINKLELKRIGNMTIGNYVNIPSTAKRILVEININSYYFSPLFEMRKISFPSIIWGTLSWCGIFNLSLADNKLTWSSEQTVIGTKASAWTTSMDVYYIE